MRTIAAVDVKAGLGMPSGRKCRALPSVPSVVAGHADSLSGGVIHLAAIAVEIQRTPVLRGLDLTLAPGQITGITGANGSGKTTLLQLAATLHRPAAGAGRILGADLHGVVPADVRRSICLIGHEAALYPQLTLRENLRFVAAVFGQPRQVADAALDTVGLGRAADRRAGHCSHGMLRRADLARALMSRPWLLLLDEPHAGRARPRWCGPHRLPRSCAAGAARRRHRGAGRRKTRFSRSTTVTGKLRMCTAIAGNRLRLERRAGEALLVIAPFGAIALLIIPMAVGTDVPLLRQVGPGMYWVVLLLFGVMVILRQSSHQTPAQARLLTLAGVPGAVRMLGNAIATTVLLLGFGAVLAPVAVLLYDPVLAGWAWFLALRPQHTRAPADSSAGASPAAGGDTGPGSGRLRALAAALVAAHRDRRSDPLAGSAVRRPLPGVAA